MLLVIYLLSPAAQEADYLTLGTSPAYLTLRMNFLVLNFQMTKSHVNFVFSSLHNHSQILIDPPLFNGFVKREIGTKFYDDLIT